MVFAHSIGFPVHPQAGWDSQLQVEPQPRTRPSAHPKVVYPPPFGRTIVARAGNFAENLPGEPVFVSNVHPGGWRTCWPSDLPGESMWTPPENTYEAAFAWKARLANW